MARRFNATWKAVLGTIAITATALSIPYAMPPSAMAAASAASPVHGEATAAIQGGDSRLNDYRLERDSCCVGEL